MGDVETHVTGFPEETISDHGVGFSDYLFCVLIDELGNDSTSEMLVLLPFGHNHNAPRLLSLCPWISTCARRR